MDTRLLEALALALFANLLIALMAAAVWLGG